MASGRELSTAEIGERLDELRSDFKDFRNSFVQKELWAASNKTHMERVGRFEVDLAKLEGKVEQIDRETDRRFDALKDEMASRYRTAVNLALGSIACPLVVGLIVGVFKLLSQGGS